MATAHIYFLRIDDNKGGKPLLANTASQLPGEFPLDSTFGGYTCMGPLISMNRMRSGDGGSDNDLRVSLSAVSGEIVRFLTTPGNAQDNDVCVHRSIGTADGDDDDISLWQFGIPKIVFLGRLSHVDINAKTVTAVCNPASTEMARVTRTATRWADEQHRQLVNPNDYGFRHANRGQEEIALYIG